MLTKIVEITALCIVELCSILFFVSNNVLLFIVYRYKLNYPLNPAFPTHHLKRWSIHEQYPTFFFFLNILSST